MLRNFSRCNLNKNQAQPFLAFDKVIPVMAETLGELITRRMKDLGIRNNSELAKKISRSDAYVGDLVNDRGKTQSGVYSPRPETLSKLCAALEISEDEILSAIGYKSAKNGETIPKRILEAIGSEGTLNEHDEILVANFIKMLKQSSQSDNSR